MNVLANMSSYFCYHCCGDLISGTNYLLLQIDYSLAHENVMITCETWDFMST